VDEKLVVSIQEVAMSYTVASSPGNQPARVRVPARRVALAGLVAVVAAVVAIALVYFIGGALVTYHQDFQVLANAGPAISFTLFAGIGATLVYALVLRLSRHPVRTFGIIAAVVFLLMLIPDLTLVPGMPGVTGGQTAVLLLMHVVAALVLVAVLITLTRPE